MRTSNGCLDTAADSDTSGHSKYLLADIGSTFTKLCAVDTAKGVILAQACSPTTVTTDVNEGLDAARRALTSDPGPDTRILVSSSAAGGLRIAAVGLVPELTMAAAREAALGAGGKVIHAFSYKLTEDDLAELDRLQPDIILLSGGTDGGDCSHILHNAAALQHALPDLALIVAGNRSARDELRAMFRERTDVVFTENVMPAINRLDLEPARNAIRDMFLNRIVHARGLDRIQNAAQILMPTPEAVLCAVKLLAEGLPALEQGLGELMAVDMGGATTDVYSCATGNPEAAQTVLKGLPEPFVKRTVEADIGMRYTLAFLAEQLDLADLTRDTGISAGDINQWVATVSNMPERLPADKREQAADTLLAREGCRLAVDRHAGRLEETFTPAGRVYLQSGKDLGGVGTVIGSGGPITNSPTPGFLLDAARRTATSPALTPRAPAYYLDNHYILWAMGLLAQVEPQAALTIMRRNLRPIKPEQYQWN